MKGSVYAPDTASENAARPETCDKLFDTLRLVNSLSPAALDKMQAQIRACNSLVSNLRTLSRTFKDSPLGKKAGACD